MRSVVITGVSRGLGAAFFHEFHARGDRILALGRRFTEGQHTAERTHQQRVRLRPTDLSYPPDLPTAAELSSFVQDASRVLLIHNAAVVEPIGAVGALTAEQIQQAVTVNLTAPMVLTNALLGAARNRRGAGAAGGFHGFVDGSAHPAQSGGRSQSVEQARRQITPVGRVGSGRVSTAPERKTITVVFISSGAAAHPVAGWAVHSTTKRAGELFFEAVAAQHQADNRLRVINVDPGMIDTEMQATIRSYATRDVFFPDGANFIQLHQRGTLAAPAQVAQKIIMEHLTDW